MTDFECCSKFCSPSLLIGWQDTEGEAEAWLVVAAARAELDRQVCRVLARLDQELGPDLRRTVFHLAWSPDTLPTQQAIAPLTSFLTTSIASLNSQLLAGNFNRALMVIWESILCQLAEQADPAAGVRGGVTSQLLLQGCSTQT